VQRAAAPTDGRAARAARTRDAIVDATVALVEEGDVRPTAPRIAARAGVSVRSVFQHFDDLPALYTAVIDRVSDRLAALVVPVGPDAPLEERIEAVVRHRADLLEAMTPYRRAAAVHAPFAPQIGAAVARGTALLRRELEATFAPELDALPAATRDEVLDALVAATAWPAWDALRTEAGLSVARASAVVARTVRSLLAAAADG